MRQADERLMGLVSDIVDLSSLISAELELDEEPVDLAALAEEVVSAARGQAQREKRSRAGELEVRLEREGEGEPGPFVRGDRRRLWQVLTNLVSNGVKFTERGAVVVRVGRDERGLAVLRVEDTGVGISELDQSSVFETFRQLGGRARSKRGSGLGLAISRRLVEMHGGSIGVSSKIGRGTVFTVRLPAADPEEP